MYTGLVVLVFARTFDDDLASLVKKIDRLIQKNAKKRIGSYVTFLGDDFERLQTRAAKFGEKHKINHVPLVVFGGVKDGPKRLRIHPDAQVTVIIYQMIPGKVVKANHAFRKGSLNPKAVKAVITDIEKHLPNGDRNLRRDRMAWVAKCLKDFHAIKLGMTRQDIETQFQMDGGLQSVSPVRFTHPECRYFKVDVEFSFKRNPQDMGRAIISPDDKATKVSKPYIELPFSD